MQKLTIFTDGGARGNPGPAGIGVVIYDADDHEMGTVSEAIGIGTNNTAEYTAIIRALQHTSSIVEDTKGIAITLKLDSELAQRQLTGVYKVKDATLKNLWSQVKELEQQYASVEYIHVKRELNKVADKLVNSALDAG